MKFKKMISLGAVLLLATSTLTGCASGKNSSEVLNIYNVGDYIEEDLLKKFEDETGIDIVYETFDTNEAMYQKVKSGSSNYDLVIPSDYMIEKMISEDMLLELDFNNIPNMKNINGEFLNPEYDDNNEYSVPYMWGTFGILYNKTLVDDTVDSWDILWNDKYEGEIQMLDSVRDTFGIALKKLGYSLNTIDPDQIAEAEEELKNQKPLVQAYVNDDGKDRLLNDEAAMGIVYSGDALVLIEENENLEYVIPKEGTNKWVDAMVVPNTAENKDYAEMFINFMLDTENAVANIDYIGYSTPNLAAYDLLDEEVRNDEIAYPSQEVLDNSEVFVNLSNDTLKLYDDAWTRIKSQ
ncbi:MAG: spermidine/putrescine ABC transporter substrate-binding protein [Peptostreptococcaceae bacterium]